MTRLQCDSSLAKKDLGIALIAAKETCESLRIEKKRGKFRKALRVGKLKPLRMVTVIVQHEVKDFSQWKPVFDADEANRAKAGVKQLGLYTSAKNQNDVTMIFEVSDPGVVGTYMSDPRLQEDMKRGGVISDPVVSVLNKV